MGASGIGQNCAMRQDSVSKSIGRLTGASLCDRFQGALLGISLLPTALSSMRSTDLDRHSVAYLGQSPLQQAINCSLTQTRSFISAPNNWTIDLVQLQNPAFLLPAYVPILLRYHDSWRRRFGRLMLLQLQIDRLPVGDAADDWGGAIAQILMLGDLIEAMSLDTLQLASQADWIAWLTDCAARYRIAPQIHLRYEGLLSALKRSDYATVDEPQRSFLTGVTSALAQPESYILAVRCLTEYASNRGARLDSAAQTVTQSTDQSIEAIAFTGSAAFVAGLLSGAFIGGSGLPALWQIRLDADSRRDLATELFRLWAGGLSAFGLPN